MSIQLHHLNATIQGDSEDPMKNRTQGDTTFQGLQVTANLDFMDPAHRSGVPLDEKWYDRIFADCCEYGLRRVYWRVVLGRAYYRSKILARVSREGNTETRIINIANILDRTDPDPLEQAIRFAHKYDIQLIAWFPFNEAYYFNPNIRNLIDPWYEARPHLFWCNRSGNRRWMGMPCIAEPEVVRRTADIVTELCRYGADGVYIVPRTHCYTPYSPDQEPYEPQEDEFGFNEPIRRRFLERFGVDICREDFDVDAWHSMKGEFYTEFLAVCAAEAHSRNKILLAGTMPFRLAYAPSARFPNALRIRNDWGAWSGEAGIDGIVSIQDRIRLPEGTEAIPDSKIAETTRNIGIIVKDAPGCPVAVFHPILAFRPAGGGSWSMKDRILEPVSFLDRRRQFAIEQGAGEFILHEGYMPLFLNTAGYDYGIGPCPNSEYWQAIRRWNS